jgi:hypothetical protein
MRSEDFLALCLSTAPDRDHLAGAAPRSQPDWLDLLARAGRQDVTALLHHRLKLLGIDTSLPREISDRLRQAYLYHAGVNTRLFHELSTVLHLLRHEKIPVVALKGAHLAELVYDNIALRPMCDVDLLLRESDLAVAKRLLLANFFSECGHDDHHLGLRHRDRRVMIELHWNLTSLSFPFNLDTAALWRRSQPATIAGVEVAVLSPEDLLLHLCLHASYHHLFDRALKYFCDVAEVLRQHRSTLDWQLFCESARKAGLARCAYLTLWGTRRTLAAEVPEAVLQSLQPPDLDLEWMDQLLDDILQAGTGAGASLSSVNLSRLWSAGGLREKLGILRRGFLPSRQALGRIYSVPADSPLVLRYYPVRWRDHFVRHGTTAWRMVTRHAPTVDRARQENDLRSWLGRT